MGKNVTARLYRPQGEGWVIAIRGPVSAIKALDTLPGRKSLHSLTVTALADMGYVLDGPWRQAFSPATGELKIREANP